MSSTPEPQVWPALRAHDARALIRFLVAAFGFEETVVYADGDVVHHAQLSWPEGGGIMLGSVRPGPASATDPGAFGALAGVPWPGRTEPSMSPPPSGQDSWAWCTMSPSA